MDSFGRDKETGREEKIGKLGMGRGHRVWSQTDSIGLRRPHGASTASQSSIKSDSSTTAATMQHSQEEKKFTLSPQAPIFVPKSQPKASQSSVAQSPPAEPTVFQSSVPPTHQYPRRSIQDRLRMAREAPLNVHPSVLDSALEDALEQQCNIQESDVGNYSSYKYDQNDVSNSKREEKQQNDKEEAYNFETYEHLNNIINILIVNPAEFDSLVPPFMDKLRSSGNMRCLQLVVTTIIEWSIAESNFRYNGARLCKYFDTSLEDSKELYMFSKELFRELLCFQCKWETGLLKSEWLNQPEDKRDQRKCNGLILFLAELVAQMDESYAFILGELLIWFITKVLQRPASSSVKYICQALKLAGHVLEKDKSRSKDMENMMRALTELVNNGQVDTHVGNMVNSVHELRKDWGRSMSNCDSSGASNVLFNEVQRQPDQLGASNYNSSETDTVPLKSQHQVLQKAQLDQPVMYGPDGEILSAEESEFLEQHAKMGSDDQGTSEEEPDDNYDDEIATAYEEFLRDTKCK